VSRDRNKQFSRSQYIVEWQQVN